MPVLREVVTRFKFDTDEQGAKKVDRRINGMKRGIKGVAALLGVSLGVAGAKALFNLGQGTKRAEFALRNLAGAEFDPLRQRMEQIRQDLERVKTGAGQIFTEREFDIAAAGFVRVFGAGRKELALFDKIFRSAAKQSGITGQNVVTLVESLTNAVRTGDFSALLDFPGVDQAFIKQLEDINELFNLGEIGGQTAVVRRQKVLSDLLVGFVDRQNKSLRSVPPELLKAQSAGKKLQDSIEDLAKRLNELLVPVLEKLNELLDKFVETSNKASKTGFFKAFVTDPATGFASQFSPESAAATMASIVGQLRRGEIDPSSTLVPPAALKEARRLGPLPGGEGSVTFNTTINVNGAGDPAAVAREVEKSQTRVFQDARANVVPTEDR